MTDTTAVMTTLRESFTEEDCPPMADARVFGPGENARSFRNIGLHSVDLLIRHADLSPSDSVLDLGCGIGRVALPLAHYLDETGRYQGLDPVEAAVEWCRADITSRHPLFTFKHVDLRNAMYNRMGKVDPLQFRFPYPDEQFDVTFLFSVFTHMTTESVRHYLGEIHRTLKPGGRALVSMFLMDDEARAKNDAGATHRHFVPGKQQRVPRLSIGRLRWGRTDYWTDDVNLPESAVAYPPELFRGLVKSSGLVWTDRGARGGWRDSRAGQDVVILQRPR